MYTHLAPYYRVTQNQANGRWLVVHDLPGIPAQAVDCDCLTQGAALIEASFLERTRKAQLRAEAEERQHLGLRGTTV